MHCASCAKLIEKKLKRTPGVVDASVNYGSEHASVEYNPDLSDVNILSEVVSSLGYRAVTEDLKEKVKKKEFNTLKLKVIVSTALTLLIIAGMFFHLSPYVLFALALPIQFWAGWEFYLAAWSGLKNRTASMDTLVAIGTSAAFVSMNFETSSVIVTLILLGRYLEARAKSHTNDAIKKLLGLAAKTARVVQNNEEIDIPIDQVVTGDIIRVRPERKYRLTAQSLKE